MADSSLDIKMQDLKLSDSPVPALIPDRTPAETYTSMFEATTPPLEPSSPTETFGQDAEAEVEELLEYDTSSLKSADIKSDPILASLARKQSASRSGSQVDKARPESVGFKARPAPSSTRQDGRGPRMTKSAALRQGLDWAAVNSPTKKVEVSDHKESIHHVPGQRRDTPQAVSRHPSTRWRGAYHLSASRFVGSSIYCSAINQVVNTSVRYWRNLVSGSATKEGLRCAGAPQQGQGKGREG